MEFIFFENQYAYVVCEWAALQDLSCTCSPLTTFLLVFTTAISMKGQRISSHCRVHLGNLILDCSRRNHDDVTFSRRTTGNRGKKERRRRKRTGKLAWKIPLLGEKRDTDIHINRREYRSTCHGEHDPFFRRRNALCDYIR